MVFADNPIHPLIQKERFMQNDNIQKMIDLLDSIDFHLGEIPDKSSGICGEIQESNKRLDDFMNLVESLFDGQKE